MNIRICLNGGVPYQTKDSDTGRDIDNVVSVTISLTSNKFGDASVVLIDPNGIYGATVLISGELKTFGADYADIWVSAKESVPPKGLSANHGMWICPVPHCTPENVSKESISHSQWQEIRKAINCIPGDVWLHATNNAALQPNDGGAK